MRRRGMSLARLMMVMGGGGVQYGEDQTLDLQPDPTAGKDSYIQSDAATTNYGDNISLYVGEYSGAAFVNRALIQFDLSVIPSNALVVSSKLSLSLYNANGAVAEDVSNIQAFRLKRAWVEAEATWNIYSTGNNWQTAGGFGANDCEQTAIGSVEVHRGDTTGAFYDLPLNASAVQQWTSGAFANNGLLLKMDTELDNDYAYRSSDYLANTALRPKFQVVYKIPL